METLPGNRSADSLPASARAFFTELGRNVAAPLLATMVDWMIERVRRQQPEILLFLSRDGRIIREVWEARCPPDLAGLPTRYALASRRALRVASLERIDGDLLRLLTHHAEGLPFRELFDSLHLPGQRIEAVIREHSAVDPHAPYHRRQAATAAQVLHLLGQDIQRRAGEEREAYLRYLDSLELDGARRVGIVDIGWHGSLQAALARLLRRRNPDIATRGYYLALFGGASKWRSDRDSMEGCLLQEGEPRVREGELADCVELLEFLFSSTEPGLLCFHEKDGRAVPVFMEDRRSAYQKEALDALREGILEEIGESVPDAGEAYRRFRRLAFHPTREEARFLGRLQARRGFGKAGLLQPFAQPGNPVFNILHWGRLYRSFKEALWRNGYWAALSRPERALLRMISPVGTARFIHTSRGR